jgi:hypothetical protein
MKPRAALLACALAACLAQAFSFFAGGYQATPWGTQAIFRDLHQLSATRLDSSRKFPVLRNRNTHIHMGPSTTSEELKWVRPAPKGKRDIVIGTRVNTATPVAPKHDEGCELSKYMQLPPEQYTLIPLPNKAKLERIDNKLFRLKVPISSLPRLYCRLHGWHACGRGMVFSLLFKARKFSVKDVGMAVRLLLAAVLVVCSRRAWREFDV